MRRQLVLIIMGTLDKIILVFSFTPALRSSLIGNTSVYVEYTRYNLVHNSIYTLEYK